MFNERLPLRSLWQRPRIPQRGGLDLSLSQHVRPTKRHSSDSIGRQRATGLTHLSTLLSRPTWCSTIARTHAGLDLLKIGRVLIEFEWDHTTAYLRRPRDARAIQRQRSVTSPNFVGQARLHWQRALKVSRICIGHPSNDCNFGGKISIWTMQNCRCISTHCGRCCSSYLSDHRDHR